MVTTKSIPRWAAWAFFVIIFLQLPLFRVPCRSGVCTTPLQVTVGEMAAAGDMVPSAVMKGLLYPGAFVHHLFRGDVLAPIWSNILKENNLTELEPLPMTPVTFRLEVVAGSYFAVGGAIVSVINPGRMGMFGILLIFWGLVKDGLFQRPERIGDDPANLVHASPLLYLALVLALLSVRYDMQKLEKLGGARAKPLEKPMRSSTKSKLKSK